MKKYLGLIAFSFGIFLNATAQTSGTQNDKRTVVEKPSRDFVMIKLTTSGWADKPDSVNTKGIGRGFAMSIMYDFPIKTSHFSFAAGLGINSQNVYFDNQVMNFKDSSTQVFMENSSTYKRYKFNTTRLEMPLEIRFFGNNKNRNLGFKAAIGANVGLILGSHTKGVIGSGTSKIIDQVNTRRFAEQWNIAPTMRIGYGNFSIYGSYSITPIFKENSGPQLLPFSLGICITGL